MKEKNLRFFSFILSYIMHNKIYQRSEGFRMAHKRCAISFDKVVGVCSMLQCPHSGITKCYLSFPFIDHNPYADISMHIDRVLHMRHQPQINV